MVLVVKGAVERGIPFEGGGGFEGGIWRKWVHGEENVKMHTAICYGLGPA